MSDHVRTAQTGAVRTILIDRPEKKNALTRAIYDSLAAAIRSADADPTVKVICLTGTGGAFSAGNDIGDFEAQPPVSDMKTGPHGLLCALCDAEKPLVAAVNGMAVGRDGLPDPRQAGLRLRSEGPFALPGYRSERSPETPVDFSRSSRADAPLPQPAFAC